MPNDMPGATRYVRTNMAVPTAGVGINPTWRGHSMAPDTVVPLLPGASFDARGMGVFNLTTAGCFPRGPRISGQRGSIDLYLVVGLDGTDRTICYLTDNPAQPTVYIAVRIDDQNRPLLGITRSEIPFSFASGILRAVAAITNTETVVIDTKTYTVQTTLTNVDGNVKQGASKEETLANLAAAINLEAGAGVKYAASMTLHPSVRGVASGATLTATAKAPGTAGNSIATTENCLDASWDAVTLEGGAGSVVQVALTNPAAAPAAPNINPGQPVRIRLTWNTAAAVEGSRFASLRINGEAIPAAHWATNPVAAWPSWQPTHFVLGAGLSYLGDVGFNGTISAAQLSEVVTL